MPSQFRFRTAFLALAAMIVTSSWADAAALAAQDLTQDQRQRMYMEVKPAVVLIQTLVNGEIDFTVGNTRFEGDQEMRNTGSGWLISPDGYLVTNGHVVSLYNGDNELALRRQLLYQFLQDSLADLEREMGSPFTDEDLFNAIPQFESMAQIGLTRELQVLLQNGDVYDAEVKQFSPAMSQMPGRASFPGAVFEPGKDVAVLKIEGRDLPTVTIGNSDNLSVGDELYAAGYPGVVSDHPFLSELTQLEPSFTRGSVSSVKMAVGGAEVMQMDVSITWGNSGGPVFNGRGEVVGMATFGSLSSQGGGPMQAIQGFNFAVPTSTVMEFVRSEGVTPSAGLFNRVWATALNAYDAGRWSAAVDGMDEVLRVHADLPDALRLRSLAVAQRGAQPDVPWLMVALVSTGLGLVGLGLVQRRRVMGRPAPAGGSNGSGRSAAPIPVRGREGYIALPGTLRLVVVEGSLRGNRFDITQSGVKIGRDPDTCQVVLNEAASSREHALILPAGEPGTAVIRNLSGTNATYVNGRPIQEASLAAGDRIQIAGSVLTFESE